MDVLSGFQRRGARVAGRTWRCCSACPASSASPAPGVGCLAGGELARIRHYCETDVLNTYLVYLRFELMRGALDARALRRGAGAREAPAARRHRSRISPNSCAPGRQPLERARRAPPMPRRDGVVDGLTHEGEGVVRGGKTAFVAGALPGRARPLPPHAPPPQHDDGELLEVLEPAADRVDAALRALRRLRRLRAAAPRARGAARRQADRAAREPRARRAA